jgi:hypothetical protein
MKQGEEILDGFPQDVNEKLVAYLSRDLSANQREAFENRILEDEFFSQQIEEAQFALLEAYAEGSLPPEVHERLTPWAASSNYAREHLSITRRLKKLSSPSAHRRVRSATLWLFAAAACLLFAALPWVFLRRHPSPPNVAKLEPQHVPAPAATTPNTILLVAERLRGAGPPVQPLETFPIEGSIPLRLQIVLPASHSSNTYSVVVRHITNSRPVARFAGIKTQGPAQTPHIEVILPAHTLQSGEYMADVETPGDLFHVPFRVHETK